MSSPLAAQSRVLDLDPRLAARLSGTPVLVTGGTGYIGQALVGALFQAGARVAVLTRSPEGARGLCWAEPLEATAAGLRRRRPGADVRLAFLEFLAPPLAVAAESLIVAGCTRIDVVPLCLGAGGHVRRDLPGMVQAMRDRHPDCRIELHTAAGETLPVIEALAQAADELTR